jgi:CDGSH-type Zn-finger protein/uncharacterized Fe-S cluster protein YjdI
VQWDGRLCIHIGECGRSEGELFVGGRKPWCQPDLEEVAQVAEIVERCPTGALSYQRKDGVSERAADTNTIVVSNNGPLYLHGDLLIDGATDESPGLRYRAALCRCGQSKNKPFCDNSHEAAGFVDRGAIGKTGPGFAEPGGGPLEVSRAPNGPLLVKGKVELVAASGRAAWRGSKAALCRCGASSKRPFCDGSHREAGFTDE